MVGQTLFPGGTFDLVRPDVWAAGVIVASPHSGRDYPAWFLAESIQSPLLLRSSEDAFVDLLIAPAVAAGAVTLTARVPRAVVDLNRATGDLDPAVVEGISSTRVSPRVASGLGVIPRIVGQGRPIRHGKLSAAEAQRRIEAGWLPYHAALSALMEEAVARFGRAILIDVHSMPRAALAHLNAPPPDIVLGDRHGRSAAPGISAAVEDAFAAEDFHIRRNAPFAGAHIAATYGAPARSRHVVQVEIDRALYMDETEVCRHTGYPGLAARFGRAISRLASMRPVEAVRLAAE